MKFRDHHSSYWHSRSLHTGSFASCHPKPPSGPLWPTAHGNPDSPLARWITSTARSTPRRPTGSGCRTSPVSQPGRDSSTSPSSSITHARRIVGWRASRTADASFVLDALEQALHDRRLTHQSGLVHPSDRRSPNMRPSTPNASPRPNPRLAASAIATTTLQPRRSTASKVEVIHRRGPRRSFEAVEYATLERVDWFNHRRRLEPIGNIPPAEAEDQ